MDLEIAIMLGFWYSEVNFRRVIDIFIKILWIKLEPIIKKKSSFYLSPKLKGCILPRYWKSEGCMPAIASLAVKLQVERSSNEVIFKKTFTPCAMRCVVWWALAGGEFSGGVKGGG